MPFLSQGFRPFFLMAAVWAAVSMTLWIIYWAGGIALPGALPPTDWHSHELIFGYGGAVLCGFLLTAIPNWTKRPPLSGAPLAGLAALWLAARIGFLFDTGLPFGALVALDLSFPVLFSAFAGREIIAGGNKRNLPVLGIVVLFLIANVLFYWEVWTGTALYGPRLGIAVLIGLICLIGGRIIPAFTRNWLKSKGAADLPAEFGPLDKAVLAGTLAGLALWVALPQNSVTGLAGLMLGAAHIARMARWRGLATRKEPLLFALHVGYAFIALGFALAGLATFLPSVPPMAAIHGWTVGAIGTMTLTVMTRATLGHSGRALAAGWVETVFLAALPLAALARIASTFPAAPIWTLHLSATLWILAFALFALRYAPVMFAPKPTART
jgi:uncharacterized protein involved in response to NO